MLHPIRPHIAPPVIFGSVKESHKTTKASDWLIKLFPPATILHVSVFAAATTARFSDIGAGVTTYGRPVTLQFLGLITAYHIEFQECTASVENITAARPAATGVHPETPSLSRVSARIRM
jgi:hypothetical protein